MSEQHETMSKPQNYYSSLVPNQKIFVRPSFALESGITLIDVPVAYSTWGTLNETRDNVLVVCHALTGSSDALDWWRPLIGPGKSLDYTRYFIFCANVLGSPYGSASPLSVDAKTGRPYGPSFPQTTIRDDIRIHKIVLDSLSVQSVAAIIGGSMGGMHVLEWPLCTPSGYVKNIIPIASSAYQGAWGISWGETQRQAVYADTTFRDGWYDPTPEGQPRRGLGTARIIGMLTYRSCQSFEARFGRRPGIVTRQKSQDDVMPTPPVSDTESVTSEMEEREQSSSTPRFSAQNYLQYQANKFLNRFDANCYIHLTKKMDTHDITRGRTCSVSRHSSPTKDELTRTLSCVPEGALVIGVGTDLLFPVQQQLDLAQCLPSARLVVLESGDGHDGFLLEFERLNSVIRKHLSERCAWLYDGEGVGIVDDTALAVVDSVFGETENVDF
ncbi:homoserine O-acetyltransferase [Paraphoma chrysanthemicola]|uniref:Homoserine O-acetyltransferase n=1 Tax=Paraphoma chrysanthemicola TaxID=798071 RepID=A0A8K0R2T7_9PLEO|nr:homoserine O-acetyltransferase [Paraphoma chrysanthemicola]